MTSTVWVYSPDDKAWTAGPAMPTPRMSLQAVGLPDGRVVALGGRDDGTTPLAIVEVLDTKTGQWSAGKPMLVERYWFGATLGPDGRIHVAGGIGGIGVSFLDDAEVMDASGAWTALPRLPEPRAWNALAATPDGRVYAIGGSLAPAAAGQPPPIPDVTALDPGAKSWTK